MNVLFWMYTSFDTQFASKHILLSIIESLCDEGHSVHVFQKNMSGSSGQLPPQLEGKKVKLVNIPFTNAKKTNLVARFIKDVLYTDKTMRLVKKEYDVVFLDSTNVLGYAVNKLRRRLGKIPIVYTAQDIFPDNAKFRGKLKSNGIAYKILSEMQRYAYSNLDRIVTISEDMKETLIKNGTDSKKVSVIYNWSYQDDVYSREKIDFSQVAEFMDMDSFKVVYAGNIGVMQNVDIVLSVASKMKKDRNIKFYIIGDGVYKENLEKEALDQGLDNVFFRPMQPPEVAPVIYSAADVNIIPLARDIYRTALPSKTATCLACGQPVIFSIGSDSLFGKKLSKETGCPVVDSDDVVALTELIYKIKAGKVQINTADMYKKEFGKSRNTTRYVKIITECAEQQYEMQMQ